MANIYISSTYEDLKDCRKAVYAILAKMPRRQIKAMEDYVTTDQRPLDKCLAPGIWQEMLAQLSLDLQKSKEEKEVPTLIL